MSAPSIVDLESPGCTDAVLLGDWHVVATSAEIGYGDLHATTLLERDLVLWRDREGEMHAWDDLCVHRGARLSKGFVKDNRVVCPYHGWNYDGEAKCVFMPAAPSEKPMKKARAIPHHVQEKYGLVWVCIGTPAHDIPSFPEWDDHSYKKVVCGPYRFRSGYRAVENFIDASHFPFVHAGVNGVIDDPDPIAPYEVYEDDQGIYSTEVRVTQPYGDPRGIPVIAYYAYRVFRPLVAYFKKRVVIADPARAHEGDEADRFCTFLTAQPVDQTTSIVRICCAMNFDPAPSDEDVRRRQDLVYAQDSAIVDTQRPERIPVELRYELHHRSDLMGQKYRSWLKSAGVTYGAFGSL
ncbi:aromatic ring-hydroxylating dioxygenase subunit alpha [Nocardia sp. NPDC024068]|uniref:aromatic ring-hydroxylating dioxygenase subunit alpha n=1 Tax=Nocardia sp. NPDC024068 TaxID=3157197 RepID=UPI0033C10AA6